DAAARFQTPSNIAGTQRDPGHPLQLSSMKTSDCPPGDLLAFPIASTNSEFFENGQPRISPSLDACRSRLTGAIRLRRAASSAESVRLTAGSEWRTLICPRLLTILCAA